MLSRTAPVLLRRSVVLNRGVAGMDAQGRVRYTSSTSKDAKNVDTSGTISDINAKMGGILGLAGAPTFTKGENVIDVIKKDHKAVADLYEKYKATTDVGKRQEYAWTLTKELVQHSEVEQLLVYPLLKMRPPKSGGDNAQHLHDRSLAEHQHIRELLYTLDQTKVDDPSHPAKLKAAVDAVTEHVKEEESEVLPLIEKNYNLDELQRLGKAFQDHKYTATTRPHPSAPLQGPFAAAANIVSKPIDLARDAIRQATEKK